MRISIVLTGYYFKYRELYQKITSETNCYNNYHFDKYILSHKPKDEIPQELFTYLTDNNWKFIFKPNIGWDWGCHVQFMQWHAKQNLPDPDYILFLHDDINVVKNGFIEAFLNKAQQGFELIGNSTPFTKINSFKKKYFDEAFILQNSGHEYESEKIEIVRGSALFLSFKLAQLSLLNLPYQKCGTISLANRSLRMFGAIVTKMVGNNKIGYLSDEHFRSKYIEEEMRGGTIDNNFFLKRFLRSTLSKLFHFIEKNIISNFILKHSYPANIENKLKVNITKNKILQGYLNFCVENNFCSDISFKQLESLLTKNMIYKIILTDFEIVYEKKDFFELILKTISKSTVPVDLLCIDTNGISNKIIKQFMSQYENLFIRIEKIPKRKGTKWVNRLYIKYPQRNINYN